ncbi:TetR/AcrR family transcriptional regulator [uncultured Ruegeria sp.]|uniref:TetR/AcrR family transcriptional regulator n=1 Tax=uncultured Ruegeria sp. TaxID=259304 RepID=UPI00262F82D4|nr:TetR/AcrR family transcriptional regulator [uncultured Ruegeria sp.]
MKRPNQKIEIAQAKPRTASKEVRRQQLIDATIESIAKNGLASTTMTKVTGIAGLSLGLANFHFTSKEKLLEETLRHVAQEHHNHWKQQIDAPGMSATEKLLAIVDAHFHPSICNRKKLSVWFAFYGQVGHRKLYRQIVQDIDEEREEITRNLCDQIVAEGGYDPEYALDATLTLENLYDGQWQNMMVYPAEVTRDHAKREIRTYLALIFPKHFTRPPKE